MWRRTHRRALKYTAQVWNGPCAVYLDHVLSGKKCEKTMRKFKIAFAQVSGVWKGKKCALFFLNNQPQSGMTVETTAFSIITETWLLASVGIKKNHQSIGE